MIALAYTQPIQAARELALAFSQLDLHEPAELLRMASLTETLVEPLSDFQPLLIYTRGMEKFARGNLQAAKVEFAKAFKRRKQIQVAKVSLLIPEKIKAHKTKQTGLKISSKQILKLLIVAGVGLAIIAIIIIEFTNPFIRPFYHLSQGNKLLDERQAKAALDEFEKVTDIQPKSAEAWQGRGDALFILGRNSGALASYNRAIHLQPQDIQIQIKILINKGKIRYNQRKYQQALENYEHALKLNSQQAEAWSGKGLALLGLRKYSEAEASFREVEAIKPNDPKIWQEIGFAVENLKGPKAAKKYFEEALETYGAFLRKKPNDVISWTDRGGVLLKLNRPQEALNSFQEALNIDNNFYEALIGKGNAFAYLGLHEDAVSAFDMAIRTRPTDYQVWLNRGLLLLQDIKDYQEALKSFNKSIAYRNDSFLAWVGKGLALLNIEGSEQDLNEALDAFDRAKELNPNDPYIWNYRAEVLTKLGKVKEAQESQQEAEKLRSSLKSF